MPYPRGVDDAAVVAEELAVGSIDPRVVEVGAENAGAQIVGHDPPRRPAEESKRLDMGLQPSRTVLAQHRVEELVPAIGERHEEGVKPTLSSRLRVEPATSVEEIDLRLLARRRVVEAHSGPCRRLDSLRPV